MIIGSVLLSIVILLALLGLLRNIFADFRVSTLVAIIVLAACPLLMFIPEFRVLNNFYINIGGYALPMLAVVFFIVVLIKSGGILRALAASVLAGTVVTLGYLFIPMSGTWMLIAGTVTTGIVAGGIAYLVSGRAAGSFMAVLLGVMLADVAVFLINMSRGVEHLLVLGNLRSFDVWVIGAVVAVGIAEVARMYRSRAAKMSNHALSYEFAEEHEIPTENDWH